MNEINFCIICNKQLSNQQKLSCSKSCSAKIGNNTRSLNATNSYINNPNLCKYCFSPILPKIGKRLIECKNKIFCTHSCSAKYNNKQKIPKKQITKQNELLDINNITKGILFAERSSWQSARSIIQKQARKRTALMKQECFVCAYSTHIEVAHIKAVSSFSKETTIAEINNISNLILLCPNHHWEYDHGIIIL